MRRILRCSTNLVLACVLTASTAHAAPGGKDVSRAAELIEALHLAEAESVLAELDKAYPDMAPVVFQRALLLFYRGQYAEAVRHADHALELIGSARAPKAWQTTRSLMAATYDLTRDYKQERSGDGRFMVAFPDGDDRVLLPYVFDVLSTMDKVLTSVVGVAVPGPIRLEVYPSAAALAQVSTLTLEQIETSGTVALCKWNRLMITTPRALVRGYPWVDTIAHELTHLYLSYATQEQAPVWLQEGTAKLLERRWRDPSAEFELEPTSRALLMKANRDGKLLSFEQLHPSIALLPSQDDATLAFAQVSTFMAAFLRTHGELALREAFGLIAKGTDARDALARASDTKFTELERSWRTGLPKAAEASAPRKLARRFRSANTEAPDESQDVAVSEARRFLRLADMLWSRHHARGAMLEYEKAHKADVDDPIVAARLARAALAAGDATRSLAALEPLLARYPEHAPTHAVRGAALFELGRTEEAHAALLEAVRINPFDPDPHCRLSLMAKSGNEARVEQAACALLTGASP